MNKHSPATEMPENIHQYANMMKEIKDRSAAIDSILSKPQTELHQAIVIESAGLQFRKIFELIAFASLAANKKEYSSAYANFSRHWEAAKLINNLRRINADFYPRPIIEDITDEPGIKRNIRERPNDYLTTSDLVEAHGRCGQLLHATSPFRSAIDYEFYYSSFAIWKQKYINLLNVHQVHLVGDTGFYFVHMHEKEYPDEVRYYRFVPTKTV